MNEALSLRVLTVNVRKGFTTLNRHFGWPELRDAVRSADADLVFLQGAPGVSTERSAAAQQGPQASDYGLLVGEIWPQFTHECHAVFPSVTRGNAVLSKYPIVRHQVHDVPGGAFGARGLLHCSLRVSGQAEPIHAVGAHLSWRGALRQRQLALLCRLLELAVPVRALLVVAGDFNDWRDAARRQLRDGPRLQEVFTHAQGRPARSFPAGGPLLRLDRIYVRNAREHRPVVVPRLPWAAVSSHLPLAAEITL